MIADVQELIDAQAKATAARSVDDSYFDNYHPSDEVYAYLDSLVSHAAAHCPRHYSNKPHHTTGRRIPSTGVHIRDRDHDGGDCYARHSPVHGRCCGQEDAVVRRRAARQVMQGGGARLSIVSVYV